MLREIRSNERIKDEVGVVSIVDKAREESLRLYDHCIRTEELKGFGESCMEVKWVGKLSKGRRRIRWKNVIERDLRPLGPHEHDVNVLEAKYKSGLPH